MKNETIQLLAALRLLHLFQNESVPLSRFCAEADHGDTLELLSFLDRFGLVAFSWHPEEGTVLHFPPFDYVEKRLYGQPKLARARGNIIPGAQAQKYIFAQAQEYILKTNLLYIVSGYMLLRSRYGGEHIDRETYMYTEKEEYRDICFTLVTHIEEKELTAEDIRSCISESEVWRS